MTTREEARRLVNEAWERSVVRLVAHYGGLAARDIAEEQRDELADAIVAAVAEERERSLAKVREIGGYYPTDVFREISRMETRAVHEHYPGIVDRISASMARFVVKHIVEEIEAEPPEDAA